MLRHRRYEAVISAGLSPGLGDRGWLIADALQPASYSPLRKTISVLAGHAGRLVDHDRRPAPGGWLLSGNRGRADQRPRARASCWSSRGFPPSASPYPPNPLPDRLRSISPGPGSARSRSRCGPARGGAAADLEPLRRRRDRGLRRASHVADDRDPGRRHPWPGRATDLVGTDHMAVHCRRRAAAHRIPATSARTGHVAT